MPKLWNATIDQHRRAVRDATMDATAALVAEHGLASVTMSRIAETTGIGRATLYKYFPDVETILAAWHEREIAADVDQLVEIAAGPGPPGRRLEAVLRTYGTIRHERHGRHSPDVTALLHRRAHVGPAHADLHRLVGDLLAEGVRAGDVRADVPVGELTSFCLRALGGASSLPSHAAVRRLVGVTLDGLRPPSSG